MYKMTCDGLPLLDARDDSLSLTAPKVNLADNTVGSCSFKIYKNHPYYDRLMMLKSVFEISDEYGVIFRGRMTENTRDIKKGKAVDLEGAMAYFNDSIVRPYTFPDDWEKEGHPEHAAYTEAAANGNVVQYFLNWLITKHNSQVSEFQRFKLGNVTVEDPNNFIERSSSEYPSTWDELRSGLFESSLGGHLCIRYETDGNYIDYLAEFTEVNEQGITYGENLRDFSEREDGITTYSAIIPRGAEASTTGGDVYEGMYGTITGGGTRKITIDDEVNGEKLPDGDITDDIVKSGDMLYSKKAVADYGWRFVPASESQWDDVKTPANLQSKGVAALEEAAANIPKRIEVKAVDLHCTDEQIRSFRMYKKIPVRIMPHGIDSQFDIASLDIDLLNPQNTDISAGKTVTSFTALQNKASNDIRKQVTEQLVNGFRVTETLMEKTETDILLKVSETYASNETINETVAAQIQVAKGEILQSVSGKYITKDVLTGYATTSYVDNQISLAVDGIDLNVSSSITTAIEGLGISGRNLLRNSSKLIFNSCAAGITCVNTDDFLRIIAASGNLNWVHIKLDDDYTLAEESLAEGEEFVMSFTMRSPDATTPPNVYFKDGGMGYYPLEGQLSSVWSTVYYSGTWKDAYPISLHLGFQHLVGTFEIKDCKLEKGNKATAWTPAPEDMATTEYVDGSLALKIVEENGVKYSQLSADVGKIVFNTGEIEINSNNFSLTTDGSITAKAGYIGDWSIVGGVLSYDGAALLPNGSTTYQTVQLSPAGLYVKNKQVNVEWFFSWANLCNILQPKI